VSEGNPESAVSETSGEIDLDYLTAALARAGRPAPTESLTTEQLHGGRTGALVVRVVSGDHSYVLKQIPEASWRGEGMSCPEGGEPRLWLSGLARETGGPAWWPVVDLSFDSGTRRYWMLMDDVGAGIRDRGKFTIEDTRVLFRALAPMHAKYYESDALSHRSVPGVLGTARVLSEPLLHLSGKRPSAEPWVQAMLDDFKVMGAFLPLFLEVLGPRLADAYLDLVADPHWQRRLSDAPATLLHGDLRRANIAFENDRVALLDWEFAAKGPPACDLQWHCYLHYWGYPPDGVEAGDDCEALRDEHADALEAALGRSIDRAAFDEGWALGWIKLMAQLGYVLVDPLYPDGGTAESRAQVNALSARAVQRALDFREALG
jgi:hypothetical protein